MSLRSSAFAAAICVLAAAAPAAAADPPLTVPKAKLDAALHCHGKLQGAKRQPIMLELGHSRARRRAGGALRSLWCRRRRPAPCR